MKPSSPQDLPSPHVTHASLSVAGEHLDPQIVTDLLGIRPHRAFRQGDKYNGRNRDGPIIRTHTSGVWALDSTKLISSHDPADHVRAVVALIHPVAGRWIDLQKKGLKAGLWIVHAREEGELGYTLDDHLVQQLADLRVFIAIACNIVPSREP